MDLPRFTPGLEENRIIYIKFRYFTSEVYVLIMHHELINIVQSRKSAILKHSLSFSV